MPYNTCPNTPSIKGCYQTEPLLVFPQNFCLQFLERSFLARVNSLLPAPPNFAMVNITPIKAKQLSLRVASNRFSHPSLFTWKYCFTSYTQPWEFIQLDMWDLQFSALHSYLIYFYYQVRHFIFSRKSLLQQHYSYHLDPFWSDVHF